MFRPRILPALALPFLIPLLSGVSCLPLAPGDETPEWPLAGEWSAVLSGEAIRSIDGGDPETVARDAAVAVRFADGGLSGIRLISPGMVWPEDLAELRQAGDTAVLTAMVHTFRMDVAATLRSVNVADDHALIIVEMQFSGQDIANTVNGTATQCLYVVATENGLQTDAHVEYTYTHVGPGPGATEEISDSFTAQGLLTAVEP
jgi:hypothetical protein